MTDLAPVRRALLSVSDKTGIVALAEALAAARADGDFTIAVRAAP